jgi:hypothetical protein
MKNYPFTFNYQGKEYTASFIPLFPQYHCTVDDKELQNEFGESHIISWNEKSREYSLGLANNSTTGLQFVTSLGEGLRQFLIENNMSPSKPAQ